MNDVPAPAPNPTPAPAPNPAPAPWYQGLADATPELTGYWANRGWQGKTAAEIAIAASKAHQEAEKFIGAPASELIRLKPGDPDSLKALNERLGVPKEAKDYDFTAIKFSDGTPLDDKFSDFMRSTALKYSLTKDAASGLAAELTKFLDGVEASEMAESTAALQAERATLDKSWGANKAANMVVAQAAARALGVDEAAVAALEKTIGYAKTMEMFLNIGSKIGEDKFVRSPNGNPGVMSADQAKARVEELKRDEAWVSRYVKGGSDEAREMANLMKIIAGAG